MDTWKLAGLYQPLPMPQTPREQIHIDFLMELPEDEGYRTIMICVDCFSKIVVLVLLHELDTQTVASCFLTGVVSHHILLETTINDRDPRFQGNFWEELVK